MLQKFFSATRPLLKLSRLSAVPVTFVLIGFSLIFIPVDTLASEDSCECAVVACSACTVQKSLSFYSEKCEGGTKVKSCAKPNCVARNPLPESCQTTTTSGNSKAPTANSREIASSPTGLSPASAAKTSDMAMIQVLKGKVTIRKPDGSRAEAIEGARILPRDQIETLKGGRARIDFTDGNKIHIQEKTQIKIERYDGEGAQKKAVIELLRGRIRNQVKQKYMGEQSGYEVHTRSAVAGVRGTDFIVTFDPSVQETTTVHTLEGQVLLKSARIDLAADNALMIKKNSFASLVEPGGLTPLRTLNPEQAELLDKETFIAANRTVPLALKEPMICKSPSARYNQCVWTCTSNENGQCNECIRRRCNANGEWKEETRQPANLSGFCKNAKPMIGPCDY